MCDLCEYMVYIYLQTYLNIIPHILYLTKKRFAYLKTWFNIPTVIFREKMALTALRVFLWRFVLFTHNHITKTSTHPYTHVHDCFHSLFPKEARCSNPRVPHYPRTVFSIFDTSAGVNEMRHDFELPVLGVIQTTDTFVYTHIIMMALYSDSHWSSTRLYVERDYGCRWKCRHFSSGLMCFILHNIIL